MLSQSVLIRDRNVIGDPATPIALFCSRWARDQPRLARSFEPNGNSPTSAALVAKRSRNSKGTSVSAVLSLVYPCTEVHNEALEALPLLYVWFPFLSKAWDCMRRTIRSPYRGPLPRAVFIPP